MARQEVRNTWKSYRHKREGPWLSGNDFPILQGRCRNRHEGLCQEHAGWIPSETRKDRYINDTSNGEPVQWRNTKEARSKTQWDISPPSSKRTFRVQTSKTRYTPNYRSAVHSSEIPKWRRLVEARPSHEVPEWNQEPNTETIQQGWPESHQMVCGCLIRSASWLQEPYGSYHDFWKRRQRSPSIPIKKTEAECQ